MRLLITAIITIGVAGAACTRGATVAASTSAVNAAAVETAGDPTGAAFPLRYSSRDDSGTRRILRYREGGWA